MGKSLVSCFFDSRCSRPAHTILFSFRLHLYIALLLKNFLIIKYQVSDTREPDFTTQKKIFKAKQSHIHFYRIYRKHTRPNPIASNEQTERFAEEASKPLMR